MYLDAASALQNAAELDGIAVAQFRQLNPVLKRVMTNSQGSIKLLTLRPVGNHSRAVLATLPMDSDCVCWKVEYPIRSGDNLWKIAQRFGNSYRSLTAWYGLEVEGTLLLGQKAGLLGLMVYWLPRPRGENLSNSQCFFLQEAADGMFRPVVAVFDGASGFGKSLISRAVGSFFPRTLKREPASVATPTDSIGRVTSVLA